MEQLFADGNTGRAVQAFSPRTTIAETENAYEIQVDLPGILKVMVPKSEAVRPKRIPISSN
jgi:HSP20 family molecular chaperone IbpA